MNSARWTPAPDPPPGVDELAAELGISPILARLLAGRMPRCTAETARAHLSPNLSDLISPWRMTGMDVAADRLARAVHDRERVVVYADYDADGVTACALMVRVLRALGHEADHYVPSRRDEGYGISEEFVRKAAADGVDLIVTVDCGTSENERVARLAEAGIDVIVTDHHEPGDRDLPPALAVLNPKRAGATYPFRDLAGVGVAFKLAWALCETVVGAPRVGPRLRDTLYGLLPTVAIGTIADVAPLVSENRVAVAHGLRAMHRAHPGIQALLEICRLADAELSVRHVSFNISPRLNAAGRMGSADLALRLLLEDDPAEAMRLARELDQQNAARQELCRELVEEAAREVDATHDLARDAAVVVGREGWHEGVIGIVAGRLAERYERPTAVVAFGAGQEHGRGSARGAGGVNLHQAMAACGAHLLAFGGHEQAAGFSIARDALDGFRRTFRDECRAQTEATGWQRTLEVDMELPLSRINATLVRELDRLRPFGQGNQAPRFLARGVRVTGAPRALGGGGSRFCFNATQEGVGYRAVAFRDPGWMEAIDRGQTRWDIVFSPRLNDYYHPPRLELGIEDMRPAAS